MNIFKRFFTDAVINAINAKKSEQLRYIRSFPNVVIAQSVQFGKDVHFSVLKGCKTLKIGENVITRAYCNFLVYDNAALIIHDNVFLNNYCSINCLEKIEIGNYTLFGEGVKIYDHNHKYNYNNEKLTVERNEFTTSPVKIGCNCWIGSNVTILKGVVIGDNVIIGSNCLIYKSIAANTIVKANISVSQTNTFG